MKKPATNNRLPNETPTPIPAFAPVERPGDASLCGRLSAKTWFTIMSMETVIVLDAVAAEPKADCMLFARAVTEAGVGRLIVSI